MHDLLHNCQDGRIKLWLTEKLLNFRREHRTLFSQGNYIPLPAHGSKEENVIAYARSYGDEFVIVAAPRFSYSLMRGLENPPVGSVWSDTSVGIDPTLPNPATSEFRNLFTGERVAVKNGNGLLCSDLFAHLPFALLTS